MGTYLLSLDQGTTSSRAIPVSYTHLAGAVGLCQRAVAAYRPAVHQSGGLVLPAGLRRGASGAGAFRLPGGRHGGAHPRHDGVGRRQRGPTGGSRRAGHSLRGDPLLALPPVCPRPSGVPLAHSHRPAVRLRGPVSYTHLDVYKRQGLCQAESPGYIVVSHPQR